MVLRIQLVFSGVIAQITSFLFAVSDINELLNNFTIQQSSANHTSFALLHDQVLISFISHKYYVPCFSRKKERITLQASPNGGDREDH